MADVDNESVYPNIPAPTGTFRIIGWNPSGSDPLNNVEAQDLPVSTATTAAIAAVSTASLQKSANLSDVANAATARTNLGFTTVGTSLVTAASQAAARAAIAAAAADLSGATTQAALPRQHTYLVRVGANRVSGGSQTSGAYLFVSARQLPPGRVKRLRVYGNTSGDFAVVLLRSSEGAAGSMQVVASSPLTGRSGNDFIAGVDFPAWELDGRLTVGIQTGASGEPGLYFDTSGGEGYSSYSGVAAGTVAMVNTTGTTLFYTVDVEAALTESGGALLERCDFGVPQPGWTVGAATFSPATRAATISSTGLASQMRSGAAFGLDRRTTTFEFSLGDSTSAIGFLTNPVEGGIQSGSLVVVSAATQTLAPYGRYTSANTPSSLTSIACLVTAGVRYIFEWTKNKRSYTATVKTLGGTVLATITRAATPVGYSTYPSYGYDQGTMQGAPGWYLHAGTSASVYSYEHRAACPVGVHLYTIGDSITERFAVEDGEAYVDLIENAVGAVNCLSSGIGGAVTAGAMNRMVSEMVRIRPKNVLIYLGTNTDASFAANIVTMCFAAQRVGANIYVATIPTKATETGVVNGLPAWVGKVDFAGALTLSGAGTGVQPTLYALTDAGGGVATDSIHPNALGHAAMFGALPQELLA